LGIHVRAPNYVNVIGMQAVLGSTIARSSNAKLGTVNGLVTSSLNVRFANPTQQWSRLPVTAATKHTPPQFQFGGGDVILELTLGIYVRRINQPGLDPTSVEIFSEVYSHELLHVFDETRALTNWLQPRVTNLPLVKRHLVGAKPYTHGSLSQPASNVEKKFHTHIQSRIQSEIEGYWATEHNRRGALRDAPAEYDVVQKRIDALRSRHVIPPRN
jgi:hypothetical protein